MAIRNITSFTFSDFIIWLKKSPVSPHDKAMLISAYKKAKADGGDILVPDFQTEHDLPDNFFEKDLLKGKADDATIKKQVITAIVALGVLSKKDTINIIKPVVEQYVKNAKEMKNDAIKSAKKSGTAVKNITKKNAFNDEALLKQRIKNSINFAESKLDSQSHTDEDQYEWLPSTAAVPDDYHRTLYGKIFTNGQGDKFGNMPGERYGCQCGRRWLNRK